MSPNPSWNYESRKFAQGFHSPHSLRRSHREFNFAGRLAIGEGRVRSMKAADRFRVHKNAESALAGVVPPWEHPGYVDARV